MQVEAASAAAVPDLSRFLAAARARILQNSGRRQNNPERTVEQREVGRGVASVVCAFAPVRPGAEQGACEVAAVARLRCAWSAAAVMREDSMNRSCGARCVVISEDESATCAEGFAVARAEERQRRVDSFVNRAFFRLNAHNESMKLREYQRTGHAMRASTPVNTALFRFGGLLHDLSPQIHQVRRNVQDALR